MSEFIEIEESLEMIDAMEIGINLSQYLVEANDSDEENVNSDS
ncbi:hypothetical protein [Vibrio marisflavi]|uniref:Uncharacterized protein n=1 Tax=Vibrio marisflavi CECT 7928 TaxID=634439 RepID=A0ABM9A1K2_9VIBR|nr:hypothetical protein [Vibrio marisflavi]CAH0536920.1 hypothetical protein VMF7928_00810 [Vibrio marisflavi CECT 7928]